MVRSTVRGAQGGWNDEEYGNVNNIHIKVRSLEGEVFGEEDGVRLIGR